MRKTFLTISESDNTDIISENIIHREREVYHYYFNIENYEALLETLPKGEWPETLVQYRGLSAEKIPDEVEDICNDLNYRDRIRLLLKTERQELKKAEAILNVLLEKIPKASREKAVGDALLRIKIK